jgi:hypothetical protein
MSWFRSLWKDQTWPERMKLAKPPGLLLEYAITLSFEPVHTTASHFPAAGLVPDPAHAAFPSALQQAPVG